MATDLETSVAELIVNTNIISDVISEDATTEVSTSNGPIPSLRKALADNIYFQDPIPWSNGTNETEFNQLRTFTDGTVWWSPSATTVNPVPMGASPVGDSNWYPWQDRNLKNNILEEVTRFKIKGTFAVGFTYETSDDVGLDNSGNPWSYTGVLPFTVSAGTVPSEPTYRGEDFAGIRAIENLEERLDIKPSYLTLAQAQASDLREGQYVVLTDRCNDTLWKMTSTPSVSANEIDVITISTGLYAEIQPNKDTPLSAYGAKGDGSDSAPAIAASIRRLNRVVVDKFYHHSGFTYNSLTKIIGIGRQACGLTALNSTSRIRPVNSGVRTYDLEISKVSLSGDSVVDDVLDMASVSSANLFNVVVFGGTARCINMQSTVNGGCVYNTMIDVTLQSSPVGIECGPLGSNDLKFIGSRLNNCSDAGMIVTDSNHVLVDNSQVELCGTGIRLRATGPARTVKTTISNTRFENNTTNWDIGTDVIDTSIIAPNEVTGTNVDNGTRTSIILAGVLSQNKQYSARQDADGSFRYVRTANGGNQVPAHVVEDESGINSPVQYEARSAAASKDSRFFRAKFGSTPKWGISGPHGVMVDIPTLNGMAGTITTTANTSVTVSNVAVNANSLIQITATNAIAAQDMAAKGVYATSVSDTSITIHTGDGSSFTVGGTFNYFFVN